MSGPMGTGGMEVDMVTGLALDQQDEDQAKTEKLLRKMWGQLQEAAALKAELENPKNPLVQVSLEVLEERLEELMNQDPICQGILLPLKRMGEKINVAPVVIRRQIQRITGKNVILPFKK